MSAAVCGKRPFFEELLSPPITKRIRCSSPVHISPSRSASGSTNGASSPPSYLLVGHLTALFPDMDKKVLAQALEGCGNDLDLAINKLNELQTGFANNHMGADANQSDYPSTATNQTGGTNEQQPHSSSENPMPSENLPKNGAEWVELFVKEMTSATHLDDARARAARALESLEKSLYARASAEAVQNFQQENITRKEQVQVLNHENTILKRAVSIQHERQKEFDSKAQELQHLKQLIPQYQEQLRVLEVNNYALSMHLKQAQQSNSIPGRFHPDIF